MDTRFTNTSDAARRLGLPEAWLRREAKAGRLPCVHAGRRLLFEVDVVADALRQEADAGRVASR